MEDPYPGDVGIFGITGLLANGIESDVAVKIIIFAVLVVLSAFFSSVETAFTSVNKARLKTLAQDGNKRAKIASMLVEKYDRMLYATLIGNNIVNIAASSIATVVLYVFAPILLKVMDWRGVIVSIAFLGVIITALWILFNPRTFKENTEANKNKFINSN